MRVLSNIVWVLSSVCRRGRRLHTRWTSLRLGPAWPSVRLIATLPAQVDNSTTTVTNWLPVWCVLHRGSLKCASLLKWPSCLQVLRCRCGSLVRPGPLWSVGPSSTRPTCRNTFHPLHTLSQRLDDVRALVADL